MRKVKAATFLAGLPLSTRLQLNWAQNPYEKDATLTQLF